MPAKQQEKPNNEREKQARQQLHSVVGEQVMHSLGQPGDLHSVQIRELWEDHYRVNIFVGANAGAVKVAHSYFLVTDGDGTITASTPNITKQY